MFSEGLSGVATFAVQNLELSVALMGGSSLTPIHEPCSRTKPAGSKCTRRRH